MNGIDIMRLRRDVARVQVIVTGQPPASHDPRLEMLSLLAMNRESLGAERVAHAITRDNPVAGFVAWEALKRHHFEAGYTSSASYAADRAADALQRLNGS